MQSENPQTALADAKRIVFRFLKFRPRSEKEVVDKLADKGFTPGTIDPAMEFFRTKKFLDDQMFARGWITSRLKKPFGMTRIRRELKQKGISDEIINQETPLALLEYDEVAAAAELAKHRLAKYKGIDKLKAKRRIYEYLIRRGFGFNTVARVVNQLNR